MIAFPHGLPERTNQTGKVTFFSRPLCTLTFAALNVCPAPPGGVSSSLQRRESCLYSHATSPPLQDLMPTLALWSAARSASSCRNCTSANCTAPPGVEQQNMLSLTKNISLTAKQMKFCSKLKYFICKYADFFSEIYRLINNARLSSQNTHMLCLK